jgi:hypothetical protein
VLAVGASQRARVSRTCVPVSSSARRASAMGMVVVVDSVWVMSGMEALATRSSALALRT